MILSRDLSIRLEPSIKTLLRIKLAASEVKDQQFNNVFRVGKQGNIDSKSNISVTMFPSLPKASHYCKLFVFFPFQEMLKNARQAHTGVKLEVNERYESEFLGRVFLILFSDNSSLIFQDFGFL